MGVRRAPRGGRAPILRAAGREARVRELAAQGKSCREIAEALRAEGVKVGHSTIAGFLRQEIDDRRTAASHVMAVEAQTSVPLATAALKETLEINLGLLRRAHAAAKAPEGERTSAEETDVLAAASVPVSKFSAGVVSAARALAAATGADGEGCEKCRTQATVLDEALEILRRKQMRDADSDGDSD